MHDLFRLLLGQFGLSNQEWCQLFFGGVVLLILYLPSYPPFKSCMQTTHPRWICELSRHQYLSEIKKTWIRHKILGSTTTYRAWQCKRLKSCNCGNLTALTSPVMNDNRIPWHPPPREPTERYVEKVTESCIFKSAMAAVMGIIVCT